MGDVGDEYRETREALRDRRWEMNKGKSNMLPPSETEWRKTARAVKE